MVDSLKWTHMPSVRDDVKPLTIVHLFPELLNLYGDGGNVIALRAVCSGAVCPSRCVRLVWVTPWISRKPISCSSAVAPIESK